MSYPAITPTTRQFKAPKWQTTAVNSQSGSTTRRLWGSRPAQAELAMTYRNITDDQAAAIVDHYDDCKGPTIQATLPNTTWDGASSDLRGYMKLDDYGNGISWYFSGPPTVNSVFPGISTVQVRLVGEIRA